MRADVNYWTSGKSGSHNLKVMIVVVSSCGLILTPSQIYSLFCCINKHNARWIDVISQEFKNL